MLLGSQVSFEDRFQDQHRCHLHHSVADGWYSQRSLLAVGPGESSPGVLLRVHTSLPLTPALVAQATVRLPLFRSARTRLHLPRLSLHWLGFVAKLLQGHLLGRPYRKGRRIDNSGFPSLWHATFLAVPRALSEVVGSRQSLLSFRSSRCLETEVPSLPAHYAVLHYYGPLRLPLS